MVTYAVHSIFQTLQGEGAQAGRASVFCRFTGCNLWSGIKDDRASATCQFCDTDFVGTNGPGGGRFYDAEKLADVIETAWEGDRKRAFVVFTGGEPLLQLDDRLLREIKMRGFKTAIETNGTIRVPGYVDWVCVSPKAGTDIKVKIGSELKLVFPQDGLNPSDLTGLRFEHFWLQPMDGPNKDANTADAVRYCIKHPQWRLSVQMHKQIGIQ